MVYIITADTASSSVVSPSSTFWVASSFKVRRFPDSLAVRIISWADARRRIIS
jgi:hypothetical protein